LLVQVLLLGTMMLLFLRQRASVDLVIIVAFLSVVGCSGCCVVSLELSRAARTFERARRGSRCVAVQ